MVSPGEKFADFVGQRMSFLVDRSIRDTPRSEGEDTMDHDKRIAATLELAMKKEEEWRDAQLEIDYFNKMAQFGIFGDAAVSNVKTMLDYIRRTR